MVEEDDISRFDVLYKVRRSDPNRLSFDKRKMEDCISEFKRQETTEADNVIDSHRSRHLAHKYIVCDKELYDCYKGLLLTREVVEI